MTPSVTMTQTFHNRQLSTFFDGCETLFCQLVGDMIQRGHVDVKNVPLGYLTVDVNFGPGLKASSTMSVCKFQSSVNTTQTHLQIIRPPSRLMSCFATDMNDMFDHLVVCLKSTSEMPSGACMALLVTKVTVGTHVFNTTLSIDLGTVVVSTIPPLQPPSHPSSGHGMLTMLTDDDDEDGDDQDSDSVSVGRLDRD